MFNQLECSSALPQLSGAAHPAWILSALGDLLPDPDFETEA